MIIGHPDREAAITFLRDRYQLTKAEADEVVTKAEAMGWVPPGLAADEAAAAASNELAFHWRQTYEVRRTVVLSIYRRLLGSKAEERLTSIETADEDPLL